jgi:hypothetical protein
MRSCLSNQPVLLSSKDIPDLVDHRYFYNKYDREVQQHVGYSSCGLSRNAVAKVLLASNVCFADKDFLKSFTPVHQQSKCYWVYDGVGNLVIDCVNRSEIG